MVFLEWKSSHWKYIVVCFYCCKICLCSCFLCGIDVLVFWCGICPCCYLCSCLKCGSLHIYSMALSSSCVWPQWYMIHGVSFGIEFGLAIALSSFPPSTDIKNIPEALFHHFSIAPSSVPWCCPLTSYSWDHRPPHNGLGYPLTF